MANYGNLKSTIDNNIYENDNQEITGSILNSVLNAMVTSLGAGYQFMGMATPSTSPGTPDQNVFYLASQAGTYDNFGGTVLDGKKLYCFAWKNSAWTASIVCSIGSGGLPEAPVDGVLYGRKDEAWEPIPQSDVKGVFKVTATINASTGVVTLDKTFAEIKAAHEDGAFVFGYIEALGIIAPLVSIGPTMLTFSVLSSYYKGRYYGGYIHMNDDDEATLAINDYGLVVPVASLPSTQSGYDSNAVLLLTTGTNKGHFYKWDDEWVDITASGGGGTGKDDITISLVRSGSTYNFASGFDAGATAAKIASGDFSNVFLHPSDGATMLAKVVINSASNVDLYAEAIDYSTSGIDYDVFHVYLNSQGSSGIGHDAGTFAGGGGAGNALQPIPQTYTTTEKTQMLTNLGLTSANWVITYEDDTTETVSIIKKA